MPKGPIPERFHHLLESDGFAYVSTIGKQGEPQTNPIWYWWDGKNILISLYPGSQKFENLKRDPRISVAISHPTDPYRYVEARGRVTIEPDEGDAVFSRISRKYTGGDYSAEEEGTPRFVARVEVARHTFQEERPPSTVETA